MYNIYSKGKVNIMEKLIKITDGKIKRLEKKLEVLKGELGQVVYSKFDDFSFFVRFFY